MFPYEAVVNYLPRRRVAVPNCIPPNVDDLNPELVREYVVGVDIRLVSFRDVFPVREEVAYWHFVVLNGRASLELRSRRLVAEIRWIR